MNLALKKYLFFDLDGTLTPSRQEIKAPLYELLPTLERTLVIVSGSKNNQIRSQIKDTKIFSLGQNGNHAFDESGHPLWENILSETEKLLVHEHILQLKPLLTHKIPNETDLVEDRGSQISFSIYGHNAPPEEKKACDGDFKKRQNLLSLQPFHSETMEVQIGGSTCLDYFKKGYHKGSNIKKLISVMGWKQDDCVYFGDALFPGGNDESVVGMIDTIKVCDEEDTYLKLQNLSSEI